MTSIPKTILVVGAGAMGSAYAGKFYEMDPDCVSLLAAGERYDRLARNGIVVNGNRYALPVLSPEDRSPPSDLIIVALKHHHLPQGIREMKNRVGDQTVFISVMNGIDSEEQIGAAYGMEKVLYAVAVGIDAVREGNETRYSTQGKILFGEAENREVSPRVAAIRELFDRAGIINETPRDMIRALWWKFMVNVGINQASALLRAPYGVFHQSPEAREIMDSAMAEVIAVAEWAGVDLKKSDMDDWHGVLSGLSPDGKTSMLQDVEAGRKTEVEMFAGRVARLSREYRISTPVNEILFRAIRVIEQFPG